MSHAPIIDSKSTNIKSLEVEGSFSVDDAARMNFHASYLAPDHFTFEATDARDGLPLLVHSEGKLLAYDPLRGGVYHMNDSRIRLYLFVRNHRLYISFAFMTITHNDRKSRILLDFPSLLRPTFLQGFGDSIQKADLAGPDFYRVVRIAPGGTIMPAETVMKVDFDRADHSCIRNFEIIEKTRQFPHIRLTRVAVNQPIRHRPLQLPARAELNATIPVLAVRSSRENAAVVPDPVLICVVRSVALQPESRILFKDMKEFLDTLDFDAVRANEQRLAPLIRQLTTPVD